MTRAEPRRADSPARRPPASAPVLWTGLSLGTFLAVVALNHGVIMPGFGRQGLGGFADAILTFIFFLAVGVVLAELVRRHHRAAARHGWRHGKRGASAAWRGARKHGGRGAAFVARRTQARWTARRGTRDAHDETDPPPLSPDPAAPAGPAHPSPTPTGGTTMTTSPARTRRPVAHGGVPGAWGAVVAHATDFQAESDGDLLNWMRGEATGAAAYAEALVEQYETCRNVIGVDPVAIQMLHDAADAATTQATTMAAAVKKFTEHYELPTQFVADGGLLAHDGRWHKADD